MFNILLDKLPAEWNGYPIDASFQTGIQISQCLSDKDLSDRERTITAFNLLFPDRKNRPAITAATEALEWFLNSYNHDNYKKDSAQKVKSMDFDIDQWRIYAAFLEQYGIDLNKSRMHWFAFMGLLSNLQECNFTRVIDVRTKKLDSKMSAKEKKQWNEAKKVYSLSHIKEEPLTEEEKEQDEEAIAEFHRMMNKQ